MDSSLISSFFNNTTNSYKFYWWYAILLLLKEEPSDLICFEKIVFKMLVLVWYPVNYYKISLGKQDQLSELVNVLKQNYSLREDIKDSELEEFLLLHKNDKLIKSTIKIITRYVPYRFVRPWFDNISGLKDHEINNAILTQQKLVKSAPPYYINLAEGRIEISPSWLDWTMKNLKIVESFTLFELFKYVEKNNPNLSNVSVKLFKPQTRKLSNQIKLWVKLINCKSNMQSVFEEKYIGELKEMSIDHFIPWSFLTHDMLWNLHPMEKSNNSSKGNKLPNKKYIMNFAILQHGFIRHLGNESKKHLVDYTQLFNTDYDELLSISQARFIDELSGRLLPQLQIAETMGFEKGWSLK